jgi:hypothetical protein
MDDEGPSGFVVDIEESLAPRQCRIASPGQDADPQFRHC